MYQTAGGMYQTAGGVVVSGGAAGAGASCCAGTCDVTATGPASMSFVGPGAGSYTAETTYKYVGYGGEFSYVKPKCSLVGVWVGGGALLIIAVILLICFWPGTITTTKPPGACLIWGDPHVKTFDQAYVNFYGQGVWWIVKSTEIHIQGRFLPTPYTKGLAAMSNIALGGPAMKGHTVHVGPMEGGQILVDGQPACGGFPSTCGVPGVVTVAYNGQGKLVDSAQSHLVKHIVHIDGPYGVHLQVMRWANHLNAKVHMSPRPLGQNGACGNFNGRKMDDSKAAIVAAGAGRVPMGESLFHHMTPPKPAPVFRCPPAKKASARAQCLREEPGILGQLLDDCVFDVCAGGGRYAAQDGMAESEV